MELFAGAYTEVVIENFLTGTGEGITVFDFDENIGQLTESDVIKNRNTSFMVVDDDWIYTFQELIQDKSPSVLGYKKNGDSYELMSEQPIDGGLPCHIELISIASGRKSIVIACYETGSIITFPLSETGGLCPAVQTITHSGASVNVERQESAHAHMIFFDRKRDMVIVPDLGIDQLVFYTINSSGLLKESYRIDVPAGGGPRHLVFHPNDDVAFVMNELTADVSVLRYNGTRFEFVANYSSLPDYSDGEPLAAAIRVSNDGRFLYCSNRRCCDTITIFEFDASNFSLNYVDAQSTYGKTPRDFILSASGKWLLVANQDSASIIVFAVDQITGLLEKTSEYNGAKSVVCLYFA